MKIKDLSFMPEFFDRYINLADSEMPLLEQLEATIDIFEVIKPELIRHQEYRYETGKWTPKDLLQHCIDTERVQAYRALAFTRGDQNKLSGMDENNYAANAESNNRTIEDLLQEFVELRKATISLFKSFSNEMLLKEGMSFRKVSVLALGFVIVGHPLHHINILKERYFKTT
ncbi:DinB family protein [Flavicella sp.]|uniref:DinB family protein n=1 Tax=Flavicella sp. TaxID=2957742 RepID=UPI00262AE317|nr:DinB family protein [Flavicella sp.]MDG1805008.1 DinB family protein [Flavicella sp.]